jgi:hypothetical protein
MHIRRAGVVIGLSALMCSAAVKAADELEAWAAGDGSGAHCD